MTEAISRCVRMDDWIFEIKLVRALKVDSYGQPYRAIAQLNVNGDFAFLDGSLHAGEEGFSAQDIATFQQFCQMLEVKELRLGAEPQLPNQQEVVEKIGKAARKIA
ncbi:hypothetical protein [Thalassotalea euphylliae]|uniref:Uncharacterized protein n=1 Tax=Thalassotalea euphylliae TaxID=1655234 RepID=A0A3E0U1V6_9GAMM|nr:hypothetical protein [Thalassotalea euphylliae]REL30680.1 hypothetical protein DXX94_08115 [Thalassotalea euphylliae]